MAANSPVTQVVRDKKLHTPTMVTANAIEIIESRSGGRKRDIRLILNSYLI